MRVCKIIVFVVLSMLMLTRVYAALDLELTQGVSGAMPVVLIPFIGGQQAIAPGKTTVSAVIKNDLQNSGQFLVKTPGLLTQRPGNAAGVNIKYWRKQKVNDVIVGSIKSIGGRRYQVNVQMVGLFNASGTNASSTNNSVVLNQSFTVPQAGLRRLAHYISDAIYQKLTGVRGIFNTKIAYVLVQRFPKQAPKYTLEVADADGFNPQALLVSRQPIMSPAWSPDGKQLAYVSFEGGSSAIYVQNLATGKRRAVSQYPGINGAPAFSPNGKQLALVLTRTGNPKIYVMNLSGDRLQAITRGYAIDTEPSWAPDGKSLLFTSNRGGKPQIYQYTFDSRQVQRLTFGGNYNARASYMPNAQGIVMMHRESNMFSIAKQNLQTGRVQVLVQTGDDESPSLSPNGKMVIYATNYGGRGVLAMVSINGRIKLRIPSGQGSVQEPAWSPFIAS